MSRAIPHRACSQPWACVASGSVRGGLTPRADWSPDADAGAHLPAPTRPWMSLRLVPLKLTRTHLGRSAADHRSQLVVTDKSGPAARSSVGGAGPPMRGGTSAISSIGYEERGSSSRPDYPLVPISDDCLMRAVIQFNIRSSRYLRSPRCSDSIKIKENPISATPNRPPNMRPQSP